MNLWIDSDGGVDDALALACALSSPDASVSGISTVFGNVAPIKAARNAALVQSFFPKPHADIFAGADAPLQGNWQHARAVHGSDGLGGASAERIAGRILPKPVGVCPIKTAGQITAFARDSHAAPASGKERHLICLGPLTNLARACQQDLAALQSLTSITIMGGALSIPPPRKGGAEFNFGSDIEATKTVLSAGLPLTIIPLDVCRKVVLRKARLAKIARACATPLTHFMQRAHNHYMDVYKAREGIEGCYPHDALSVAAVLQPDMFKRETSRITLDESGVFAGLINIDEAGFAVQLATDIDQRLALDWIELCLMTAPNNEDTAFIKPHTNP